jgi:hypothetical protein
MALESNSRSSGHNLSIPMLQMLRIDQFLKLTFVKLEHNIKII